MISHCNTNPSSPTSPCHNTDNRLITSNPPQQIISTSRSPKCYRPLQQLYKTVYTPTSGDNSSRACICQPADRYKTTNMTYGSFHYNNWAFIQKIRRDDKKRFARCVEQKNVPNSSKYTDGYQPTSDACCCTEMTSNY